MFIFKKFQIYFSLYAQLGNSNGLIYDIFVSEQFLSLKQVWYFWTVRYNTHLQKDKKRRL